MATALPSPTFLRRGGFRGRTGTGDLTRLLSWSGVGLLGLVTLVAVLAPVLAPHDPITTIGSPFVAPGHGGFLLGSDSVGRDILSRVLYGVRASWFAALGVVIAGLVFGGTIGLIAGSAGGRIDSVLMRITDLFLALPAPVMAIAIGAALGPGFVHTLLAVSVVWWPFYARIVRGEVRRLAARPHMEAAPTQRDRPSSARPSASLTRSVTHGRCDGKPRHRRLDPDFGRFIVPWPRSGRAGSRARRRQRPQP